MGRPCKRAATDSSHRPVRTLNLPPPRRRGRRHRRRLLAPLRGCASSHSPPRCSTRRLLLALAKGRLLPRSSLPLGGALPVPPQQLAEPDTSMPEVDPSQSTGAGGLPVVVPMLDLGGNLPAFPGAPGGHHPHAGASPDDEVRRPAGICPDGFCRARGAIKEVERGWGEGRPTPVTPETSCVQEPGPGWRRRSPHPLSTLL